MKNKYRVNSEHSKESFKARVDSLYAEHPYLVFSWRIGKDRSLDQNDMTFELYTRIGRTLYGGDVEHARRECKLRHGVPILREEDDKFKESYDRTLKPLGYNSKLEIMQWFPVSSLMTVKQCRQYIDSIMDHYAQKGVDVSDLCDTSQ